MIEDLLTSYVFEKLDKQIVAKIPYCLLFALILFYFFDPSDIVAYLAPIAFLIFLVASIYFNYKISQIANKMWSGLDVKTVLRRMTEIYEKGDSFLKDLSFSKQKGLKISGVLSGIALTITLILVFLFLLQILPLENKQIIIPFSVLVCVFLMFDLAKGEVIAEPKKENNLTQVYDVLNTYMIENSATDFSPNRKVPKAIFILITRILSPLIYYTFPKYTYKELCVFNNPKLREFINQISQGRRNIRLKQSDGYSLQSFFVTEDCDDINDLVEKLPNDLFPYLFSPDYKFSDKAKKKWIALQVLKKQSKKKEMVGQMFIHMFRTHHVVDKHKRGKLRAKQREILIFMMMGERSTIQYIFTKINTMAVQCPLNKVLRESG